MGATQNPELNEVRQYCLCNNSLVKDDRMIGCDNEDCEIQWYHFSCIGISEEPPEDVKWYCDRCKSQMAGLDS